MWATLRWMWARARKGLKRIYSTSLKDAIDGLAPRKPASPVEPPTVEFLRSAEYTTLMGRHLPHPGIYDLYEAQNDTRNYRFRHREIQDRLGVFRWRGMQKHLATVLELVTAPGAVVVDFGGAAGPLGLGTTLVDQQQVDCLGRAVKYHSLDEIEGSIDVIFSSHTLEHIPELEAILASFTRHLSADGHLLLHLPSVTCERWRAGNHLHKVYNPHVWTFGIGPKPEGITCQNYLDVRDYLGSRFRVETLEYCGDDSIFVHARPARGASA